MPMAALAPVLGGWRQNQPTSMGAWPLGSQSSSARSPNFAYLSKYLLAKLAPTAHSSRYCCCCCRQRRRRPHKVDNESGVSCCCCRQKCALKTIRCSGSLESPAARRKNLLTIHGELYERAQRAKVVRRLTKVVALVARLEFANNQRSVLHDVDARIAYDGPIVERRMIRGRRRQPLGLTAAWFGV